VGHIDDLHDSEDKGQAQAEQGVVAPSSRPERMDWMKVVLEIIYN